MIVIRVFSDAEGESHVEDLEVPMEAARHGIVSSLIEVSGAVIRESDFDGPLAFHNARWRHLCVPVVGSFEIECSDGSRRLIKPGTIMLGEDTTGRGHASVEVDVPRVTLLLPLPPEFDVSSWKRVSG